MALLCLAAGSVSAAQQTSGIARAVRYLEAEVERWKPENGCFSCHNNGDGARVLILAGRAESPALAATRTFLHSPSLWTGKDGKPDPLAVLQYALALDALSADASATRELQDALRRLAAAQQPDGHWRLDAEAAPGSPVTYGPVLGTALACRLLQKRGGPAYAMQTAKAAAWLERQRELRHPLDVAARLLALPQRADAQQLMRLQAAGGSWNGGEVFDTAIAAIALAARFDGQSAAGREALTKARVWLLQNQLEPGGWPGTTRPSGGQSYAQHISTTAWALEALLAIDRAISPKAE